MRIEFDRRVGIRIGLVLEGPCGNNGRFGGVLDGLIIGSRNNSSNGSGV